MRITTEIKITFSRRAWLKKWLQAENIWEHHMIAWFLCFSWKFWLKHNAEVSRNYTFKQIPKVMHFPQDKLLYDYKPLYILYLGLLLVLVIALYLCISDTQIPFIFQVSFFLWKYSFAKHLYHDIWSLTYYFLTPCAKYPYKPPTKTISSGFPILSNPLMVKE